MFLKWTSTQEFFRVTPLMIFQSGFTPLAYDAPQMGSLAHKAVGKRCFLSLRAGSFKTGQVLPQA